MDLFLYHQTLTKFWKDLCITEFVVFVEVIFSLQIGFRQKYSANYALIYLTDKIKPKIDKHNYACRIFLDFQKAFDSNILSKKLEYYGARSISN